MKVYWNTDNLPKFKQSIVTIGSFDGVHLGHRKILRTLVDRATEQDCTSICISFHPHPRHFFDPNSDLRLLTSIYEKIKLLEEIGIDHFVIVPFDLAFSQLTAEQYVQDFLVRLFSPTEIIIGYDHHFGRDRKGNTALLRTLAPQYNFNVLKISQQTLDEIGISSTQIRKEVKNGNFHLVNQLLGYNYPLNGKVIRGKQIGRELGYPTANLDIDSDHKLIPPEGVYAVEIVLSPHEQGTGMMYIGKRPTLNDNQLRSIEVHIFDFNREIYNASIEIRIIEYIRSDIRFESMQELKDQLREDEHVCRKRLNLG